MIYEYQCRKCQEVFNAQMSLLQHDQGEVACPHCQNREVDQRWTGFFARTRRKAA